MPLIQTDKLTRIILTIGDAGNLTGASTEGIRQIADDESGQVVASNATAAGFDPSDPTLQAILGQANASLAGQVNQLQAQLDAMAAERDALQAQLDAVSSQRDALQAKLDLQDPVL